MKVLVSPVNSAWDHGKNANAPASFAIQTHTT